MTKEMRPAHRIDILSHALVYYGMQKKLKLCKNPVAHSYLNCVVSLILLFAFQLAHSLVTRWKRAKDSHYVARETFLQLCSSMPGQYCDADVGEILL